MNLIIDVGNSYTKLAIFEKGKLLEKHVVLDKDSKEKVELLVESYPKLKHCIIAVVGKWHSEIENYLLRQNLQVLMLTNTTKVPFDNLYETPHTLGIDRIALASASVEQFPNTNVLVIDAGTCITYDFINANNQYLGGAIALGVQSRYRGLHEFTAKLPLLKPYEFANLIGVDTDTSIHSGVINGIVFEIEGVIAEYKKRFPDMMTILTGGDANFLAKQLKSTIFANQNFLIEGLNFILEYNKS